MPDNEEKVYYGGKLPEAVVIGKRPNVSDRELRRRELMYKARQNRHRMLVDYSFWINTMKTLHNERFYDDEWEVYTWRYYHRRDEYSRGVLKLIGGIGLAAYVAPMLVSGGFAVAPSLAKSYSSLNTLLYNAQWSAASYLYPKAAQLSLWMSSTGAIATQMARSNFQPQQLFTVGNAIKFGVVNAGVQFTALRLLGNFDKNKTFWQKNKTALGRVNFTSAMASAMGIPPVGNAFFSSAFEAEWENPRTIFNGISADRFLLNAYMGSFGNTAIKNASGFRFSNNLKGSLIFSTGINTGVHYPAMQQHSLNAIYQGLRNTEKMVPHAIGVIVGTAQTQIDETVFSESED